MRFEKIGHSQTRLRSRTGKQQLSEAFSSRRHPTKTRGPKSTPWPVVCSFVLAFGVFLFWLMAFPLSDATTKHKPEPDSSHESEEKKAVDSETAAVRLLAMTEAATSEQLDAGHVHVFYYPWFGTVAVDGEWVHWNHEILPHWMQAENDKWPIGKKYEPPLDVGSSFYPQLGAYSSADETVIDAHFESLSRSSVRVLAVSWHSPLTKTGSFPKQDAITNDNIDTLFRVANRRGDVQLCFHLEPYSGRTAKSTKDDVSYLMRKFAKSPALFRTEKNGKLLPVFYVYDSYKMDDIQWRAYFDEVRGTELDGVYLALYLDKKSAKHVLDAKFDGFYTYFGSDSFTYGSNHRNWVDLHKWASEHSLWFVPSVSPGYDDTRVRPWNRENTKDRRKGEYYKEYWRSVFQVMDGCSDTCAIPFVSVTSFNEFHEGTQIESVRPMRAETAVRMPGAADGSYVYKDYEAEGGSDAYMQMTARFADKFNAYFTSFDV